VSTQNTVPTIRYEICMAGDIEHAKQVVREYCYHVGLCVTVEPVTYIYTGGEEAGFRVGLINYPRFPSTKDEVDTHAVHLAVKLRNALCQRSYTIIGPDTTFWYRDKD